MVSKPLFRRKREGLFTISVSMLSYHNINPHAAQHGVRHKLELFPSSGMLYGNFYLFSVLGGQRRIWHWRSTYTLLATTDIVSSTYTYPPMMLRMATTLYCIPRLELHIMTQSMAGCM